MAYIIGIDAGGTKTTATAFEEKNAVFETQTGFGNLTVNFDDGIAHICEAIDNIIRERGTDYEKIVLGCAGIETGDNKQKAKKLLTEKYGDVFVTTNDAMLALYSALEGDDGILIIAGTGSIGYLKKRNEIKRFGGWGHLINDDGSGYSIAIKAIRYITYSFDTNNSDTVLKRLVFEKLNISELKQLIEFTYNSSKGEIASLVPVVEKAAMEGDMQAQSILSWAGERLAYLVIGLCRQYNVHRPRIVVSGSVIKKTRMVKESFCNMLNEELDGYTLSDKDFIPQNGALYIE